MSIEAMKQALEALEKMRYRALCDKIADPAITSLRQAIAEESSVTQEPRGEDLYFPAWTAGKNDLSDYYLVGELTLAGVEDDEYGQSEIDSFSKTIDALQEKLVNNQDSIKVPLLAYVGGLNSTHQQPKAEQEPKREWVGLTLEDRDEIRKQWFKTTGTSEDLIPLVEAKLKEKNT